MSECTHHCDTCQSNCGSRETKSKKLAPNGLSNIKRVVAVVSGKGGVGKSTVTTLLAIIARRRGLRVGILDADITGPSIPRAFGLKEPVTEGPDGLFPVRTKTGIEVISVNSMLPSEDTPVTWRGPVLAGTVEQFWNGVVWDDLDVLFIDCPPGTGDVPLTVLTRIPVDAAVMVTSPQGLVSMIVEKAVRMAEKAAVPVLGLVENYSYYICPNCDKQHTLYGESHADELAARFAIDTVARLPMSSKLSGAFDKGMTELFEGDWLDAVADRLLEVLEA